MIQQDYLDFISAVGATFCEVFLDEPEFDDASPHDFQEVLWEAIGDPLSPELLNEAKTDENLEKIVNACKEYFEIESVEIQKIRSAIEKSLRRWPIGSLG